MFNIKYISKIAVALSLFLGVQAQSAENEFLVKIKDESIFSQMQKAHIEISDYHKAGQLLTVTISKNEQLEKLIWFYSNPLVQYVVPNSELEAFDVPLDFSKLKTQYALSNIKAQKAWEIAGNKGLKSVVVAVIDTGVDYKHKNLSPNMVEGYDFARNDSDPMDEIGRSNPGHGTHCAGIIGATGLIEGGIVGIAPGISLMPLRFLDQNGRGDFGNAVKAIDYAIEQKVQIISASWGGRINQAMATPLIEAIERANQTGILFVVAAANDGKNNDTYDVFPANAPVENVLTVAASNSKGEKPTWSNFGKGKVHIASPGDAIVSTLPNDAYGPLSGTSMATPLVAGLAALVKSQDGSITPLHMKSLLQASAHESSVVTACGCEIDAAEAVNFAKNKLPYIHPQAASLKVNETTTFEVVNGAEENFEFNVSDTSKANIDAKTGKLNALQAGDIIVNAVDKESAQVLHSRIIRILKANGSEQKPAAQCPFDSPELCNGLCYFIPILPWCTK